MNFNDAFCCYLFGEKPIIIGFDSDAVFLKPKKPLIMDVFSLVFSFFATYMEYAIESF